MPLIHSFTRQWVAAGRQDTASPIETNLELSNTMTAEDGV